MSELNSRLASLNAQFGIADTVQFIQQGELIVLHYRGDCSEAKIVLQGGHLIAWTPAHQHPLIWLSDDAVFREGKSIRGGIPICWPWFGAHATDNSLPAHGFARTQDWQVSTVNINEDQECVIELTFNGSADYWPYATPLSLRYQIGASLSCDLITRNETEQPIVIGGALHTYFAISHIGQIKIRGLENKPFIDTLDHNTIKQEAEAIHIDCEIDRIYADDGASCLIEDYAWKRRIMIEKTGSHSSVVWNPWIDKSQRMGDMGESGFTKMVCLETTNAAEDVVTLAPGASHCLSVTYSLFPLTS